MIIMRPSSSSDLDAMVELASLTTFGLSTLPSDREFLGERIEQSVRGFENISHKPQGETYLFVMEDTDANKVIGTSGAVSKVGGFEPFYAYHIETVVRESEVLGIHKEIQLLKLVEEHDGPSEIGSLFLHPDYQGRGLGRLLSCARFLFIAQHPDHFEKTIIAELRGVVDEQGHSPFWEALGKHFFDVEFPKADAACIKNKSIIADLMPRHPIYIPLLPWDAQKVIGEVHERTAPALKLLEGQGFSRNGMVDIFEAGPIVSCERDAIRSVRDSYCAVVQHVGPVAEGESYYIVSNTVRDFRAVAARIEKNNVDAVTIGAEVAEALQVSAGDPVRIVSINPNE